MIFLSSISNVSVSLLFTFFSIFTSSENSDPYLLNIDTERIYEYDHSIQMYYYLKKYSSQYNIPEKYAFCIAYEETTYRGPLDVKYSAVRKSSSGALGPMQIMPLTAKHVLGYQVPKSRLSSDIDLNVHISMKLLRSLHDKYNNWGKVFGAYNTGKPVINSYAKRILQCNYQWVD
jgi:soluble lytic murein transglycosylase-like protein